MTFGEPGGEVVADWLGKGAAVSAVNWAEAISRTLDRPENTQALLLALDQVRHDNEIDVVAFDVGRAGNAGYLRTATRRRGLSLGDRACLALARMLDIPVVTADRGWADVDPGARVELIR